MTDASESDDETAAPTPADAEVQPAPAAAGVQQAPAAAGVQQAPADTGVQHAPADTEVQHAPADAEVPRAPADAEVQPAPAEAEVPRAPADAEVRPAPADAEAQPAPADAELDPAPDTTATLATPPDAAPAATAAAAGPGDAGASGAAGWGLADARRAETYLRLLAETELRAALAYPRVEPPSWGPPAPVRLVGSVIQAVIGGAELVTRPLRPAAVRAGQAARPWAERAGQAARPWAERAGQAARPWAERAGQAARPWAEKAGQAARPWAEKAGQEARPWAERAVRLLSPPARTLAPPVRRAGQAASLAGWRALAAASTAGARWRHRDSDWEESPSWPCLHRVQAAASALAITGALGAEMARSVADNMERALVLRQRIEDEGVLYDHRAGDRWHERSAPPPAGPVRAVPIGATLDVEAGEELVRLHLLALVLAAGQATMTLMAQQPAGREAQANDEDDEYDEDLQDLYMVIEDLKMHGVDDRGGTYRLHMDSGGGSDWLWEGQFAITPVPSPGIRWLEITVLPGRSPIHVDLSPASVANASVANASVANASVANASVANASVADAGAAGATPAGRTEPSVTDRAERVIDIASHGLLSGLGDQEEAEDELPVIADQVRALQAVGALRPGSPALARLLALARRLGCRIPAELAAAAAAAGLGAEQPEHLLPEGWRTDPELYNAPDGRAAIAPATAVLPELDGALCVVTGVRGSAEETTVKVLAWGWPLTEFSHHEPGSQQFRWLARDDTGRWHIGYEGGSSYGDGAVELDLTLTPPVHPAATSLDLTLCGISGEVTVTLPLNWIGTP